MLGLGRIISVIMCLYLPHSKRSLMESFLFNVCTVLEKKRPVLIDEYGITLRGPKVGPPFRATLGGPIDQVISADQRTQGNKG